MSNRMPNEIYPGKKQHGNVHGYTWVTSVLTNGIAGTLCSNKPICVLFACLRPMAVANVATLSMQSDLAIQSSSPLPLKTLQNLVKFKLHVHRLGLSENKLHQSPMCFLVISGYTPCSDCYPYSNPKKLEASLCPAPPPGAIIGMGTPGGELSTCPKSIKCW